MVRVWDMREFQSSGQRVVTITPAFAYQWTADGALEPTDPARVPASRGTFSMWWSGQIWAVNALSCDSGTERFLPRPYIAFYLSRYAWSPDGSYLAQVNVAGRYDAPGPLHIVTPGPQPTPATCRSGPPPDQELLGPPPDNGLRSAMALASSTGDPSIDVEWRPDGKRLAAVTFGSGGLGSAVLIFDSHSGATLRRFTPNQLPISGSPGTGPAKNFNGAFIGAAWSPDGRRLLVETAGTGVVPFILGPGALG
jgi:WD40 repeat protein